MKCPRCEYDNTSDSVFCSRCGTQLIKQPPAPSVTQTATFLSSPRELTVGGTFAGRYQVTEELGKGGMGRVYKAYDTEIREHVALKVLNPEIAADEGVVERFRNELKLARRISHRNVCRMFDLGRVDDTAYISMEYVSGEDLKTLLRRIGHLPARKAVGFAEQVADGLAEAHRLGVVHRDLKPQNIMIDREGTTRILDFGIARALKTKGITDPGMIIGTPDYMAPEQFEGKDADQRTDIYALGAILYEMLTSGPPFEGETPLVVAMKHKTEKPRDPRETNPQIPEPLSRLILRCLEKDREKRFQSAEEVLAELRAISRQLPSTGVTSGGITKTLRFGLKRPLRIGLIVTAMLVLAAAGYLFFGRRGQAVGPPGGTVASPSAYKSSLAVLPFEDLSQLKDQEAFSSGITDDLITKLSTIGQLKVISRQSVMRFKSADKDIRDIGKELGVENILEGSIQREKDNIRVNVKLSRARDGANLWGETYDRKVESIFTVQDEISRAVVNALRIELVAGQEYMLVKRYTQNPDAYSLYMEGRLEWNKRTEPGLKRAIELYQDAIAKDPKFALAYAGIADAYSFLGRMSLAPPQEVYPKARETAETALEMDDALAEGYIARGFVKYNYDWDWIGAEFDFNWAVGLNPNYASAYQYYGALLTSLGRFEEAMAKFEKARELDPNSIPIRASIASLYYYSRQYDQAIKRWRDVQKMDPGINWVYDFLGWGYLQKGAPKKALKEFEKAEGFPGGSSRSSAGRICALALAGKRGEAEKELTELIKRSGQTYVSSYYIAVVFRFFGEKERALEYLEKAYTDKETEMSSIKVEPQLDSLRDDPRFDALLEKMNLR
jgi:eukaryotic-like serine/threonine-protein kinase